MSNKKSWGNYILITLSETYIKIIFTKKKKKRKLEFKNNIFELLLKETYIT